MTRIADLPEANLAIFASLLNFVWELAQVPLFEGMPRAGQGEAIPNSLQLDVLATPDRRC